jgi:hypothetical protein
MTLSPRRISVEERDAVARKIAGDPEVERALTRFLAAHPRFNTQTPPRDAERR